jgi:hypothetical protein
MLISATLQTEVPHSPELDPPPFVPRLSPEISLSPKGRSIRSLPQNKDQLMFVPSMKIEAPFNDHELVLSKDDMKTLNEVRKLLKPALRDDPVKAKLLMDFLQSDNPTRIPTDVSETQKLDQN